MRIVWCWRCEADMPMLDETEFAGIDELYRAAFRQTGSSIPERFKPVCDLYEQITGVAETNANAIMHHRISLYGSPCVKCRKPLRTPQAAFCAACGYTAS